MGADGVGLFQDDTADDVRGTYREALEDGRSDEEAEQAVLAEFADGLDDPDDGPVIWLALAFTQSKLGRLTELAHHQALAVIDSGTDLHRWQGQGHAAVRQRTKVLEKIRAQLDGPQPERKKVRRPSRTTSALTPGAVLAYQAPSGRFHLMRVARMEDNRYYLAPVIKYLDYAHPVLPAADALDAIPDRTLSANQWRNVDQKVIEKRGQHEHEGFHLIGHIQSRPGDDQLRTKVSSAWVAVALYLNARDSEIGSTGQG